MSLPNSLDSEPLLQFFDPTPLPFALQEIVAPLQSVAQTIVQWLPANSQRYVALVKLIEVKDALIRTKLMVVPTSTPLVAP